MEKNFYNTTQATITRVELAAMQNELATTLHSLYTVTHECYMTRRRVGFEKGPNFVPDGLEQRVSSMAFDLYQTGQEFYEFICVPVFCDHSATSRKIVPVDLFMLILARMFIIAKQSSIGDLANVKPRDFAYARKNHLVRTMSPFLSMNMKDTMNTIKQLAYHWLKLKFDEDLIRYVELLEYRCFMFLCEAYPSSVHNLVEYCKEIPVRANTTHVTGSASEPVKLYTFSDYFLNEVSTRMFNFRIRISIWYMYKHVQCPKEFLPTKEDIQHVRDWLEYQSKNVYGDKVGTEYRKRYYRRQLRPGEMEEYRRLAPHDVVIDQRVIQRVRGDQELKALQARANREEYHAFLKDDEDVYPISCGTMANLLLGSYFEGTFSQTPWSRYCIFYEEIQYRFSELRYVRDPIIIQTFNRFQVYFREEIYILDSYVKAVACWLNIVDRRLQGYIEHGELPIIQFFATIFGNRHPRVENLIKLCHQRFRKMVEHPEVQEEEVMEEVQDCGDGGPMSQRGQKKKKRMDTFSF